MAGKGVRGVQVVDVCYDVRYLEPKVQKRWRKADLDKDGRFCHSEFKKHYGGSYKQVNKMFAREAGIDPVVVLKVGHKTVELKQREFKTLEALAEINDMSLKDIIDRAKISESEQRVVELNLSNMPIKSIFVLEGLSELRELNLEGTGVTMFGVLAKLKKLECLILRNTAFGVIDAGALRDHPSLKDLDLVGTKVSYFRCCSIPKLEQLSVVTTFDLSTLKGCAGIKRLHLAGGGKIEDLSPLYRKQEGGPILPKLTLFRIFARSGAYKATQMVSLRKARPKMQIDFYTSRMMD